LIEYLADALPSESITWRDWSVQRVEGGHNNILYHATSGEQDVAIKFTRRDERNRAEREFAALRLLQTRGLHIAPAPLLLDQTSFTHPVIAMTWLDGCVDAAPPTTNEEWRLLVEHFATIHRIKHDDRESIAPVVTAISDVEDGKQRLENDFARIPPEGRSPELIEMSEEIGRLNFPVWPTPSLTLCRVDPNILNIVRRPGPWASVDWEYSGWGDPAFEIADLMAHPAYVTVGETTWDHVVELYCQQSDDPVIRERIRAYHLFQLAFWTVLYARKRYEFAAGVPQKARLVQRPPDWAASIPRNYVIYLARTQAYLRSLR
jgi:aminoglycoside phosphotransferase (APT) family kinase protein